MTIPLIPYIRHSDKPTAAADRCDSPEVQLEACRRYAAMVEGTLLEPVYDRLVSARLSPLATRPGGRKLLERLSKRCGVVVQRLDRLFRSVRDGSHYLEEWAEKGIALHLANEGGVSADCSTVNGWQFAMFALLLAELEPRRTSERLSEAFRWKQDNGRKVSSKTPYGQQVNPADPKRLVPDLAEQAGLQRMKALAVEGRSLSAIGRQLEKDGFLCRGKRWHHQVLAGILKREGLRP